MRRPTPVKKFRSIVSGRATRGTHWRSRGARNSFWNRFAPFARYSNNASKIGSCGISGEEVENQWDLLDKKLPWLEVIFCHAANMLNRLSSKRNHITINYRKGMDTIIIAQAPFSGNRFDILMVVEMVVVLKAVGDR